MRHGGGFHTCVIWTESRATGQQIGSRWWQILTKEAYTSVHLAHLCTLPPSVHKCAPCTLVYKPVCTNTSVHKCAPVHTFVFFPDLAKVTFGS